MPSEVSMSGAGLDREPTVEDLKRDLAAARQREVATAEILRIICETRTDIQHVFDTIIASAVNLCGARTGSVFRFDGQLVHSRTGADRTRNGPLNAFRFLRLRANCAQSCPFQAEG